MSDEGSGIRILCPECGDIVTVEDPSGLVRALHLLNECSVRTILTQQSD